MQTIFPCLWYDKKAEEAARFYTSIFPNSKITTINYYSEASAAAANMPVGAVLTAYFELNGQPFLALNGGPVFTFSPAISLVVTCDTQEEIDHFWTSLSTGGQEGVCGWLTDKYGVSWQIVPAALGEMMSTGTPDQINRLMQAVIGMKKLNVEEIRKAWGGNIRDKGKF
jgi:predicted 3-demethylubiquinone-9 3-methyltransferase (glyoxalase superfamily)